jgi:hypothetical protein
LAVAAIWMSGCGGDALGITSGTRLIEQRIEQEPRNDVDLLFVIDNSTGMTEKQQALARAFPAFMAPLRAAPGGLPNLRVGVVSSDMGATGSRLTECDGTDRGLLQPPATGCAAAPRGRFLITLDGGSRTNFTGDISDAFGCLSALGTAGCGFEQPLAAARRALDVDQPLENEGFLRGEALLALVFLSDEDDCSAPAATDLFEPSTMRYGPQRSFRCNAFGHTCGGRAPAASATPLADCRSAEGNGKLVPVADYVRFFKGLKAQPEQVVVAAIAGSPSPYVVRTSADGDEVAASCQGAGGSAAPGVRLKELTDAFGGRGSFVSACEADLGPGLGRLADTVVKQLGSSCLMAAPFRLTADGKEGVPDCGVSERAGGLGREVTVPRCETTARPMTGPCWRVTPNAEACESSGYELKIDRGETTALPGTIATARCRVCVKANDPRCK